FLGKPGGEGRGLVCKIFFCDLLLPCERGRLLKCLPAGCGGRITALAVPPHAALGTRALDCFRGHLCPRIGHQYFAGRTIHCGGADVRDSALARPRLVEVYVESAASNAFLDAWRDGTRRSHLAVGRGP